MLKHKSVEHFFLVSNKEKELAYRNLRSLSRYFFIHSWNVPRILDVKSRDPFSSYIQLVFSKHWILTIKKENSTVNVKIKPRIKKARDESL